MPASAGCPEPISRPSPSAASSTHAPRSAVCWPYWTVGRSLRHPPRLACDPVEADVRREDEVAALGVDLERADERWRPPPDRRSGPPAIRRPPIPRPGRSRRASGRRGRRPRARGAGACGGWSPRKRNPGASLPAPGGDTAAMLDLLTEAVAAAPSRCTYAEARHVATDEEDLLVRNGRVDHVDSTAADGVGVRVRAGRRLGLRGDARDDARGRRARACAGAGDRREPARGAARAAGRRRARARALVQRPRAGPVRRLAGGQARAPVRRRGAAARRPAHRPLRGRVRQPPRAHRVRLDRGRRLHAGARRVRRLDRRDRRRRRRAAGPLLPGLARQRRRLRRLGARPRPRPRRACAARRGRGARAARGAGLPGGPDDADPRRRADGAADPRVDRPRARARPDAAHGGVVRGRELGRARRPRHAALRLRAPEHHRRRDAAGRAGHVRLGRRGRRRRAHPAHRGRPAARRAVGPRLGGGDRPRPVGRLRARRRLRAPADRAHDERVDRARRRRLAGRPRRRHRRRPVPRDEPLVVDRRPPAALPVRHGGRARDPRRRARPACCETPPTPA